MTVMIDKFFGIPPGIIRLGKLKSLSGVAVKLYVVLWHQSERYRTRRLRCTTTELERLTGCSRNALITARADLAGAGLVQGEPYGRQGFIMHLCNPETGKPWPEDPQQRVVYEKKRDASQSKAMDVATVAKPKIVSDIGGTAPNHSQRENLSPRADSALAENPVTAPALPPISWDDVERTEAGYEIGLSGAGFPFGYNAPASPKPVSNPAMESLCGVFD
jgi:hypothetical protein